MIKLLGWIVFWGLMFHFGIAQAVLLMVAAMGTVIFGG